MMLEIYLVPGCGSLLCCHTRLLSIVSFSVIISAVHRECTAKSLLALLLWCLPQTKAGMPTNMLALHLISFFLVSEIISPLRTAGGNMLHA